MLSSFILGAIYIQNSIELRVLGEYPTRQACEQQAISLTIESKPDAFVCFKVDENKLKAYYETKKVMKGL